MFERIRYFLGGIVRNIIWFVQKAVRGYSDADLFDLGWTISKWILPRLKAFKKCPGGYPYPFKTEEKWVECIDKMIRAFEIFVEDDWFGNEIKTEEKEQGLKLFAKYIGALWN